MLVGLGHVAFYRAFGHLQPRGNIAITEPFQLTPEKGPPHGQRQPVQQLVQRLQGFQQGPALFWRRCQRLRQLLQCIQIGLFQAATGVKGVKQAFANGQQISTRLANIRHVLGAGQHLDEGILTQVSRIPGVTQLTAQPIL